MNIISTPPLVPEYSTFGTLSRQAVGDKDDATTEQVLPPIDETPERDKADNLPRDRNLPNKEQPVCLLYSKTSRQQESRREAGQVIDKSV